MEKNTKDMNTNDEINELQRFKELQEAEHFAQSEDTNKRVHRTVTYKQAIILMLIFSIFQWVGTTSYGRWHSGAWFFEHGELLAAETLRADKAERTNKWLWHSDGELNALLEDDPKLLTDEAWTFFCMTGTTSRIEGFKQIIEDGNHPRLKNWYYEQGN
jgi:hypothetical protein